MFDSAINLRLELTFREWTVCCPAEEFPGREPQQRTAIRLLATIWLTADAL